MRMQFGTRDDPKEWVKREIFSNKVEPGCSSCKVVVIHAATYKTLISHLAITAGSIFRDWCFVTDLNKGYTLLGRIG